MKSVLVSGLELALARLRTAINNPNLPSWLETAFGNGWELANAKELIGQVAIDRQLPKISVVAGQTINGGKAAFDNNTGEIYVSQEFLTANQDNSDVVASILLEELGHYFDRQLNAQDSAGDEGAIFAALVQGKTLSTAELASLKAENDRTTAVIDGTVRELELAGPYGNIAVDGNLADWSANDRIDFLPGTAAANHEVYGKFNADATNGDNYLIGIKSDREIGVGSTIWLNTDRNAATGYQIFGNTGGAEYHIQVTGVTVDASGNRTVTAALYTGAEGQTPVPVTGASNIDYKLSADGKNLEVAIPTSLLGTTAPATGIDVLADINNTVYLPGSYNNPNKLTITKQSFTPKNTYGTVTLDGNLADWQTRDRLDAAGSLAAGYAVYGKNTADGYVIGIESAQAISTGTTVWLNTDNNAATGYQIFGNSVGAEYNVNFGSDGKAYLYSGAEGQTFVSKVDYALSADGKKLELGLNKNNIPTAANGISVVADVNNSTFLPGSFATPYRIASSTATSRNTYGNVTLDGSISDWTNANRLDLAPNTRTTGYALYGKNTTDGYTLGITSAQAIGANTTVWIDADRNATTGYQIFGNSGGAEYNINIDRVDADGTVKANLYSGAAGQNLIGQVDAKLSADKKTIEFGIDRTLMTTGAEGIKVLADVNDAVFLPGSYAAGGFNVSSSTAAAPTRTDASKKVGIVFSETSAAKFFDRKAYSQLFTNAQNQAMQAGVSFDLLTEADLKDLTKIVNYDTLVFPSFTNVNKNDLATIESNLLQASYQYGVGMITSGEFMTNDETGAALGGDPYARMKSLFDVTRSNGLAPADITLKVKDTAGGILQSNYTAGEQLASYTPASGLPVSVYSTVSKPGTILAEQTANGQNYNAVIATQTGGRNLHFANPSFFADSNIGWQGLDWSVFGNQAKVGLDMTRNSSMFISRDDVDQSRFTDEAPAIQSKMTDILTEWKTKYGFVGSHYINIGVDGTTAEGKATIACCCPYCVVDPNTKQGTDWNKMRPIYQKWIELGNEIGTHSYTHPDFSSNLTAAQLEFEFNQSAKIIGKELGINVTGAATPGNPESLFVDQEISKYFQYISGVGTSYNNAFGFLTPDTNTVYFAPNLSFDFTLINFKKLTTAQAEAEWAKEYAQLTKHGSKPFLEFSWHDYAATELFPGYTKSLLENFIARAYNDGTEFITLDDAQKRIRAFEAAKVTTNQVGNTVTANVEANNIGNFALSVAQPGAKIQNVTNYFAYNDNAVFMTKNGGNFTINLGTTSDDVSRIVALDQRNELISVTGDGTNLDFTFKGEGTVKLDAKAITADQRYRVTGADSFTVAGDKLDLKFTGNAERIVKLQVVSDTAPTVAVPLTAVNETANIAANRVIDLSKTFIDIDKDAITLSIVGNTNTNLLGTALNGTNLTLQYNDNYVYGNSTITVRATAGGKSVDTSFNVAVNPTSNQVNGTSVANTLNGTANSDIIKGFAGNDRLFGGAGNDVLIGVDNLNLLTPGRGEQDFLQGDAGADRFILGSKAAIYYNDGDNNNQGKGDFAAISGFNAAEGDVIQLKGKAADYFVQLEFLPSTITMGTAIYNRTLGQPELIGFVNNNFSLTNSSLTTAAFAYV